MDALIAETQHLHRLTFGQQLIREADPEVILQRLRDGHSDMPLLLEWQPDQFHSILLKHCHQERVYFYNPQQLAQAPVGATLVQDGPLRRVEEAGLQSLSEEDFRQLVESGKGCCLVSP